MSHYLKRMTGLTLDEWRAIARRDDCLDQMVPKDLRYLITALTDPDMFWDHEDPEVGGRDWSEIHDDAVGRGPDTMRLMTGKVLPDIWTATSVLTVDEDGDPEDTEIDRFDTEGEARACFPESLDEAREFAGWKP